MTFQFATKRTPGTPTTTDVLGILAVAHFALAVIYYHRRRPRQAAPAA
jgi:hypothetical protein